CDMHHGGISNDAEVTAFTGDASFAQRDDVVVRGDIFFNAAIQIFVLEEYDRIVIANGSLDQTLGVVGAGGTDDFQAGRMDEPHLWILRVERTSMHIAAARTSYYQRRWSSPSIVGFRHHVDDLVESAADEIHELEFGNRTHAGERGSEGGADDGRFGNWGVNDALGAEAVDEAVGDLESSAVYADVFADAEDSWVTLH